MIQNYRWILSLLVLAALLGPLGCARKATKATLAAAPARLLPPAVEPDIPRAVRRLPAKPESQPETTLGQSAVRTAMTQIGKKYVWGGIDPERGFDCSGLIKWSYGRLGVELPRKSTQMFRQFEPVEASDLLPGDLLFYKTRRGPTYHVALYAGNATIIHAARRGKGVRMSPMLRPYWVSRYKGARRVPAESAAR